jgi:hypothetical protein
MRQIQEGQRQAVVDRLQPLEVRRYRQRGVWSAVGVRVGVWFCMRWSKLESKRV